jgi:hypothetical protein
MTECQNDTLEIVENMEVPCSVVVTPPTDKPHDSRKHTDVVRAWIAKFLCFAFGLVVAAQLVIFTAGIFIVKEPALINTIISTNKDILGILVGPVFGFLGYYAGSRH